MNEQKPVSGAMSVLPPLPEPFDRLVGHPSEGAPVFTASQMREYALAALSRVRGKAQEPVAWTAAVEKAAQDAAYVFKDSCNHTAQAIDYMKATLHESAPQVAQVEGWSALQAIIDYSVTDPANMDAANMKLIAIAAMTAPQVAQEEGAQITEFARKLAASQKPGITIPNEELWHLYATDAAPQSDAQQSEKDAEGPYCGAKIELRYGYSECGKDFHGKRMQCDSCDAIAKEQGR